MINVFRFYINFRNYKLPPRNDNKTTTKGPAATTSSNDASCNTTVKDI